MVSRAERSMLNEWWWTIDRLLLAALFALILIGLILTLAASPAVAERIGIDNMFHFVNRQAMLLAPALAVMIGVSFLTPRSIRHIALVVFCVSMILVVMTLLVGVEVKGARRWIFGIQPSEFLKPTFVILAAWLFSESAKRPDVPGNTLSILLLGSVVSLLILQPDFGQTMLVAVVWSALFFMAGLHWFWVLGLGSAGLAGIFAAYLFIPHVTSRIDKFMTMDAETVSQPLLAMKAFTSGGFFGKGPGEGTIKRILPDSHTDYIAAVSAEEFGIIFVMLLVALFAFIVLRGLTHALKLEDPFCRFATAGLILLFGLQSSINLLVNLNLIPAKGMTLPFVSYGGSSLLAVAYAMGMVLALTRRRPRTDAIAFASHWQARAGAVTGAA